MLKTEASLDFHEPGEALRVAVDEKDRLGSLEGEPVFSMRPIFTRKEEMYVSIGSFSSLQGRFSDAGVSCLGRSFYYYFVHL